MQSRPKVLFLSRRFPPSVGGMQLFAASLSASLRIKTDRLDMVTWGGSNKWLSVAVLPWLFFKALYKLWTARDQDIIHIQDGVSAPLGWLLHVLSGKPYIVVTHGLDLTYHNRFYQAVNLSFIRRAVMVTAVSEATREQALAHGIASDRCTVIPLGMDDVTANVTAGKQDIAALAGNPELADATLLLTVGRLVKRKGAAWFIGNVLPAVVAQHPKVIYVVVGEGPEQSAIEKAIADTKLARNVCLLGRVSEEAKLQLYKTCDIFVMPNIKVPGDMEGFGLVAQEAAVAGLPVVASNLEGISAAITDGKNGRLLPPENAEAYRQALLDLLVDEKTRRAVGAAAKAYTLKEFSWDKVATHYLQVYRQVLEQK